VSGRLEGKVAIVTGAGSSGTGVGIGQAISIILAREGSSVLLVDKAIERAQATLHGMDDCQGHGSVFVADVSQPSDCEAMVAAAVSLFGGLDILVNNASISRHGSITEASTDLYESTIAVNLRGTYMACRYAVPALVARGGGSIVNISSVAGIRDTGTAHPAYCASKAAQLGLTVDLAGEYGRANVRVNAVLPGMVATPLQQSIGQVDPEIRVRLNLLGRMGNAWDIAHAVLFLCSDEATYITGITLPVDGGATVAMPASAYRADRRGAE
jgi:NAD(P)-dependent dehydrogenase (short-subunit alcohol dehydrogenase family)